MSENHLKRDSAVSSNLDVTWSRSSQPEVFYEKVILKICSQFTGEQPCRSVISIKLLYNFVEITLRHGCSPVNLLHIFRTPFPGNTSGRLLLLIYTVIFCVRCIIIGITSKSIFFKCTNKSHKKILNNNSPKTDPWGTPKRISFP